MAGYGRTTRLRDILGDERSRAEIDRLVPGIAENVAAYAAALDLPVSVTLEHGGWIDPDRLSVFWAALARIEVDQAPEPPAIEPDPAYEDDLVTRGSAVVTAPASGRAFETAEIVLHGPSHGNPFVDVELTALFELGDVEVRVGGFYDGDGRYVLRFLPQSAGDWTWRTSATARSLDGLSGTLRIGPGDGSGLIRVAETFHFADANGRPFVPIGTTAYAWTHQSAQLQRQTLDTLASGPFTKVRMCVFPKSFDYNHDEPTLFPFERGADGWDLTRFDPAFFQHLEEQIAALLELGIQADLILFHPYDRWGFAEMGSAADDRYVSYVVRRLAALPNVWWSLANEYDFVWSKKSEDWHRLAGIVVREDHVGHLLSIHNGAAFFDNSADWVTHASLQKVDPYRTTENVTGWRSQWGKPVVVDETGYEGDIDWTWGNLSAVEMVRRFWEAATRGGYATHGETYWNEQEELWWSKGGQLRGDSPARIAFLSSMIQESPSGRLDPLPAGEYPVGGVAGEYEVHYFGVHQPRFFTVHAPAGRRVEIDVIDTWAMTVERFGDTHEGSVLVRLPGRPSMAIRTRTVTPGPCSD
jgi:hypothetical protein